MRNGVKRVLVVCELDRFANGLRPVEIQRFLHARGHRVHLFDTQYLIKSTTTSVLALRAMRAAVSLLSRRWQFFRRRLFYFVVVADYRLRRRMLGESLSLEDFDLIICENPWDAGVLTLGRGGKTLYDCPTPQADQLWFEGLLTRRQHQKLRKLEIELFENIDHLAFHWESYGQYVIEHYGISGHNLMTLNFGCNPASKRAEFDSPPKVIYLGFLALKAIDLPLLSRLTKLYPHIDVYGAPPPDPRLGLNYFGYAHPSILQQYQLGLITSTKDQLRLHGFSAKHLDYLAHGLPVLVPGSRRRLDLLHGSVPYDESNFLSVIEALSDDDEWRRTSDEAYAQATRLAWDETLRPLEELLNQP